MLKIYNSLTHKKENFKPIHFPKVGLYVCGITVYDYCHIGHARSMIVFDVVVRYLLQLGYDVNFIRNITDVDDKIINRARENNETTEQLTARFIQAMNEDARALGLLPPNHEPRATEYITEIIALISKLLANHSAYIAENGDVYFNVRNFLDYGQLSNRDVDKLRAGVRIEINDLKRDPLDFILWKIAKPGEPKWPSPWGEGRPGWHIECSAMSTHELGQPFDIHGGGLDLKFPHHENEIAQSEAACNVRFANTWMHVGLLQLNNEKMSKSLGNYFTIKEVLAKHEVETIRYFMLMAHYRSPINYSNENLTQAYHALSRLYLALLDLPPIPDFNIDLLANDQSQTLSQWDKKLIQDFFQTFQSAMNDDFNTPEAIAVLFEMAHQIQRWRSEQKIKEALLLASLLKYQGAVLGILQKDPEIFLRGTVSADEIDRINQLIKAREQARINKAWQQADEIRDQLQAMGVVIEDSTIGTRWRKTTLTNKN